MTIRGALMYGNALPRAPSSQIGTGLGTGSSVGTTSFIPPDLLTQVTGQEHVVALCDAVQEVQSPADAVIDLLEDLRTWVLIEVPLTVVLESGRRLRLRQV